jgi:Carboxypeptidase regulatory-like domain
MYSTLSRVKAFQILVLVLCSAVPAYSQSASTSLRGTILDPNGAVVPDAGIALSNPEIGANLSTRSDKNGFYQFQDVRPRTYVLTVTAAGFATFRQDGLVLLISTPATRDVQLQIATGTTTVEVQSGLEVINTQDATLGATFDSKQILALPFEGRDAAGVLSLQPGVTYTGNIPT